MTCSLSKGAGQIAREFEQRLRAALAAGGDARLETQAGRELAGQQAHQQHHTEGHQVLHVADGKRQRGATKKKSKPRR
jgi:hypothetical protein